MAKNVLRTLGAAVSLLTAQIAFAGGDFSVFCSYRNNNLQKCAAVVADIVTDKFLAKFPVTKFEIFVHSNIHSYTNGGYAAYAVAGVITSGSSQFPERRFSSSSANGTDRRFSAIELANEELRTFRAAVTNLMEQCEISPDCDVYRPRDKK